MSGFHLASIGFLGTSGCTALYPGFGLNKARCCSFIRTILRIIRVNGSIIQQQAPRIVCGVVCVVGKSHHAITVVSCNSWAPAEIN